MNWSDFSRFVGDIFGAPLAIEGLLAFFLESAFVGLWIFRGGAGCPRRSTSPRSGSRPPARCCPPTSSSRRTRGCSTPSATRSTRPRSRRADRLRCVLTNSTAVGAFFHTITACFVTAGIFVVGISAWQLRRKKKADEVFRPSMKADARHRARRERQRGGQRRPAGPHHDRAAATQRPPPRRPGRRSHSDGGTRRSRQAVRCRPPYRQSPLPPLAGRRRRRGHPLGPARRRRSGGAARPTVRCGRVDGARRADARPRPLGRTGPARRDRHQDCPVRHRPPRSPGAARTCTCSTARSGRTSCWPGRPRPTTTSSTRCARQTSATGWQGCPTAWTPHSEPTKPRSPVANGNISALPVRCSPTGRCSCSTNRRHTWMRARPPRSARSPRAGTALSVTHRPEEFPDLPEYALRTSATDTPADAVAL